MPKLIDSETSKVRGVEDVTAPLPREVRVSLKVLTGGRHVRAISL